MNQSDIFRLLLVVLLVANSQLSSDQLSEQTSDFSYEKINELLILTMALSLFSNDDSHKNNTTF